MKAIEYNRAVYALLEAFGLKDDEVVELSVQGHKTTVLLKKNGALSNVVIKREDDNTSEPKPAMESHWTREECEASVSAWEERTGRKWNATSRETYLAVDGK